MIQQGPHAAFATRPEASASTPVHVPRLYTDEDVFRRERDTLFASQWIFATLANEIAEHNDFARVPLLGHDVIVQNFHGELRAFINSCSHRHSILHDAPRGNRPLICPYHGWAYDKRGAPVGIPGGKTEFAQVLADPMAYALQSLDLEAAGHFVFVRLQQGHGADRQTLRDFLGETFGFLEQVSAALGHKLDDESGRIAANWKIVIENSLEGYHVPHVHNDSLGAIEQFSEQEDDVEDFYPASGHNYMHNAASPRWLKRWSGYAKDVGRWPMTFPHYVHQLVFPILTITSFLGYSFHIQRFHPDAVNRTTVHSRIYASRFDGQTERGKRIVDTLFDQNVSFTHKVFDEDRLASERAHEGALQATRPSLLAAHVEQRLADFRATYHRLAGAPDSPT